MKLDVTGVETIEITDPKGLCNPPAPLMGTIGRRLNPLPPIQPYIPSVPSMPQPSPSYPSPFTGDTLAKSWKHTQADDGVKWGVGLAQNTAAKKWADNWKSGLSPEQQQEAFDHGYTDITQ